MVKWSTPLLMTLGVMGTNMNDEDAYDFDKWMMDEEDIMENGGSKYNIEESARRDFDEFDVNKDGQLDPLEIRTRFKGYLNERDLFFFFDASDKDHSGTVSWDEYLGYIKNTSETADNHA